MDCGQRTSPTCWRSVPRPCTPTAPVSCESSTSTTSWASSSSPSSGTLRALPRRADTNARRQLALALIPFQNENQLVYRGTSLIEPFQGASSNVVRGAVLIGGDRKGEV